MTEQFELYQKAVTRLINSALGRPNSSRTILGRQVLAVDMQEFLLLPTEAIEPMQDLDPTSPTFGEFVFVADLIEADSTPIS